MKRTHMLIAAVILVCKAAVSQITEGKLETVKVPSAALEGNLFGDKTEQEIAVYLPPTYSAKNGKKFPVLYFLCGYGDEIEALTETGYFQGFKLKENMDKLINEGAMKEMIVVISDNKTFLEGAFYTNSPVSGNYEDFYTRELVKYIDSNYRTIDSHDARAIAGHSMGGTAALHLSMKHPDIYCLGYGLGSGLFAHDWVKKSPFFGNKSSIMASWFSQDQQFGTGSTIRSTITFIDKLQKMSKEDAHTYYTSMIDSLRSVQYGWMTILGYAYGSAYAGNTDLNAPYFEYPFHLVNDTIVTDSTILAKWNDGFGGLASKIDLYKDNLRSLKEYVLDYGQSENWQYVASGHTHFHELLNSKDIPHTFISHNGDHGSNVKQQIENSILPLCSNTLEFDTLNLNAEADILELSVSGQIGDAIINHNDKSIEIIVSGETDLKELKPNIQTSVGADIMPKSRESVDFSEGTVIYTIYSESGLNSKEWVVHVGTKAIAIKESENTDELIYTNPVNDILKLNIGTGNKPALIEIYTVAGTKVYTGMEVDSINVTDFRDGVYTIKVQLSTGEVFNQKMIKK